ncbi:histone deacetylase family protein [Olivibacter sitiensis]|uniref:histone deacetylase family protein n=1 Tax=Olivibacter sitiensis TaxID=376470 RepID=UPI00056C5E56|nr:histone deacetylase [Olivibacter sitiensis]
MSADHRLKIAFDPCYIHPLPPGHRFPMQKYELIPLQLLREGVIEEGNLFVPGMLDEDDVLRAHTKDYWERLRDLSLDPREIRRTGFILDRALVDRESSIVQGTIESAHNALEHGLSFNIAGGTHHAGSDWGEGFCLLNDQAIAAQHLLAIGLVERILIVDLDVHQGNGTAEIFGTNDRVFTFSVHAEKNFPFRKEKSDLDIGLNIGIGDEDYLEILEENLIEVLESFHPQFVFYQSGVDVLQTDKLGHLNLTMNGCALRDELVFQLCKMRGIPVQVSMGGGYSAELRFVVQAHCQTFKKGIEIFF